MTVVTLWKRTSTNFRANNFVKINGTESFSFDSEIAALRLMGTLIKDKETNKAIMEGITGRLTWVRKRPDEDCIFDCDDDGYCYEDDM